MNELKTGDIVLFDCEGKYFLSSLIKKFTNSRFTHVGMILKDPKFIHPSLKGYYIWESGKEEKPDPQDNKIKLGVQITPFAEIYEKYKKTGSKIYIRKIEDNTIFTDENLKKIHDIVYDKPYDIVPLDWIEGYLQKDPNPQKTDRFWCSALIGYIYTKLEILNSDTDWSILRPCDFSYDSQLQFKISLSENIEIL
jgi:hypothetical protein